jgi:hypothetical protein
MPPTKKSESRSAPPVVVTVERRQLITVVAAKAEHRTQYSEYAHSGFVSQEFVTENLDLESAKKRVADEAVSMLNTVMDAHRKDVVEKAAAKKAAEQNITPPANA